MKRKGALYDAWAGTLTFYVSRIKTLICGNTFERYLLFRNGLIPEFHGPSGMKIMSNTSVPSMPAAVQFWPWSSE